MSDFNQNLEVYTNFTKLPSIKFNENLLSILQVVTHRYGKTNGLVFAMFCYKTSQNGQLTPDTHTAHSSHAILGHAATPPHNN